MKRYAAVVLFALLAVCGFSQSAKPGLTLDASDLYFVRGNVDGPDRDAKGIHLYIRKKPDIQSVMLVETHTIPGRNETVYAYRALEWNAINGNEIRYLNGKPLKDKDSRYSLISSTPEKNDVFGECFHIYIPETVEYGYVWSAKHAIVSIEDEDDFVIRTFSKKYCDYTGDYSDNACVFPKIIEPKGDLERQQQEIPSILVENGSAQGEFVEQEEQPEVEDDLEWEKITDAMLAPLEDEPKVEPVPEKEYVSEAERSFNQIAREGGGLVSYTFGTENLSQNMISSLDKCKNFDNVEIVFALDATGSMDDDFQELLRGWLPRLRQQVSTFKKIKLGLLLYKDYGDDFSYKNLPVKYYGFTESIDQLEQWIRDTYVDGGGDTPEAVYEALYAGINFFDWSEDAYKKIILIGDAEPHAYPRGDPAINKTNVVAMAKEKNIVFDCIIIMKESDRAYFESTSGLGIGSGEETAAPTEKAPVAEPAPSASEIPDLEETGFIVTDKPVEALLDSLNSVEK